MVNIEKFDSLVSKQESKWHQKAAQRIENKEWQTNSTKIALCIISYIKKNKTSQVVLAKRLGVKPQALNRILQGKENLSLKTIERIECALGLSLISIQEPLTCDNRLNTISNKISKFFEIRVDYSIRYSSVIYSTVGGA